MNPLSQHNPVPESSRLSTGIPGLDEHLGGGLLPGTLTAVVGGTGLGKTQLGLSFAAAGASAEGRRGIVFDMNCRGDSQNHAEYASRLAGWSLQQASADEPVELLNFFTPERQFGDYLQVFGSGSSSPSRRVSRKAMDFEDYQLWHTELARKLTRTIAFFYGNFIAGCRRVVVDGIEPVERAADSVQLELFEYILHQILRKDPQWLARDLFRQHFRAQQAAVDKHPYDPAAVGSLLLVTAADHQLETLLDRPLEESDLLATANTLIYLGRVRDGMQFRRALYIAKHRGSRCSDQMIPYRIEESGIAIETE